MQRKGIQCVDSSFRVLGFRIEVYYVRKDINSAIDCIGSAD